MSTMRPEVLAFLRAAQALISSEDAERSLPLSDEETDRIVECVTKLNRILEDGEISPDGDLPDREGDGHP